MQVSLTAASTVQQEEGRFPSGLATASRPP